ncbi:UNKNOWN [Stylonychia lemnae]|uniref:Uncharacterized protein n=1 Tax=Stylonychia lemnae TaxID=5949 RepID=A0A078ANM2_STYLE|nr:UNKNOWN [Stylonychia lemnae]|eukprot:CDW83940.1 UNKNOWN [Stylonychia lemnae]
MLDERPQSDKQNQSLQNITLPPIQKQGIRNIIAKARIQQLDLSKFNMMPNSEMTFTNQYKERCPTSIQQVQNQISERKYPKLEIQKQQIQQIPSYRPPLPPIQKDQIDTSRLSVNKKFKKQVSNASNLSANALKLSERLKIDLVKVNRDNSINKGYDENSKYMSTYRSFSSEKSSEQGPETIRRSQSSQKGGIREKMQLQLNINVVTTPLNKIKPVHSNTTIMRENLKYHEPQLSGRNQLTVQKKPKREKLRRGSTSIRNMGTSPLNINTMKVSSFGNHKSSTQALSANKGKDMKAQSTHMKSSLLKNFCSPSNRLSLKQQELNAINKRVSELGQVKKYQDYIRQNSHQLQQL